MSGAGCVWQQCQRLGSLDGQSRGFRSQRAATAADDISQSKPPTGELDGPLATSGDRYSIFLLLLLLLLFWLVLDVNLEMAIRLISMWSIMGCVFTAAVDQHSSSLRPESSWITTPISSSTVGVSDRSGASLADEWTESWKDAVTTVDPEGSAPATRLQLSSGRPSDRNRPLTSQVDGWDVVTAAPTSSTPTSTVDAVATPDYKTNFAVTKYSSVFDVDSLDASAENVKNEESDDPWPWLLFILNGNTTVASRRQRDLGTYLRLNLAARLDADYNDVVINRILLTQTKVMANISVEPSHLIGVGAIGLDALSQGNVTLLELSGQEFLVDRIIRADEFADQR